jgi:hypothetical protein
MCPTQLILFTWTILILSGKEYTLRSSSCCSYFSLLLFQPSKFSKLSSVNNELKEFGKWFCRVQEVTASVCLLFLLWCRKRRDDRPVQMPQVWNPVLCSEEHDPWDTGPEAWGQRSSQKWDSFAPLQTISTASVLCACSWWGLIWNMST